MVDFLRKFVCEFHTYRPQFKKLMLIKRLEDAEAEAVAAEEAATSKQPPGHFLEKLETGAHEGSSSGSALADRSPGAVVPARSNSTDGRIYAEEPAGPSEDSASRGPVVTGDGTASSSSHFPARNAALGGSVTHDTGERASDTSSAFEPTTGTVLQNHPGVSEAMNGASESRPADVQGPPASGPLASSPSSFKPTAVPDSLQAVDSRATSLDGSYAHTYSDFVAAMDENMPNASHPHLQSSVHHLDGDHAGANVKRWCNEDGELAPVLRTTRHRDEAATLLDA